MAIQKVFQAGNSQVVAIPKNLAQELGLRVGHKVVMQKTSDGAGLVITRADEGKKHPSTAESDQEFQQWLDVFMKENGEILDELAHR
jgi:antitoxin component of MazEF toxin-antitoxin module